MDTQRTALVTGAAGFLGSHLVDRLLKDGWKVIGIDNFLTGSMDNIRHNASNGDFHFIEDDIVWPRPETSEKFSGVDVIFHTAAIARTLWTIQDPELSHRVTATGTLTMLELARKHGIKRFVHSSSCIVYVPNTPYFVAKQCAEEYTRIYKELYGLSTIALRYSNIYGARQSEKEPAPNVFAAFRKSKKELGHIIITGDGEQTRDYTHVSDIVEANILAAEHSSINGAFYVGTGKATSLNQVAPYFQCEVEYVADRQGDIKHLVHEGKEFKEALGWEPKVDIKDGIKDVLNG